MNSKIEKVPVKIRLTQSSKVSEGQRLEDYLTPEERKAAKEIVKHLDKKFLPNFERASLEPSNIVENIKDPYKIYISLNENETKIYTDGRISKGKILNFKPEVQETIIEGYNYIVIYHHMPSHTLGMADTKKYTVVTKTALTRLYVKELLGMPIN